VTGPLVVAALLLASVVIGLAALRPPAGIAPGSSPASPYHGPQGNSNADPYGVETPLPRAPTGPLTGDL
jgi:hypothetical protein